MHVTVISNQEVRKLLPMAECIEVMAETFRALGEGEALFPQRSVMWQPDRKGALGLMPSWLGSPAALGAKIVSVFPGNADTPYESHQGAVLLFETANGRLQAMVDAGAITAIRTAAVSALATRLLAHGDACDLAILGSGTQAEMHLVAMQAIRPIKRVLVWSRSAEHARSFADTASECHHMNVMPVDSPAAAVEGADLVCTVTGAREPVLRGEWLTPGTHINAVGASVPSFRELDTKAVVCSRLFVDRTESAFAEADDIRIPLREKAIKKNHVQGELADLVLERVAGRVGPDDITLFKSVGIAVEDLAAARYVYEQAEKKHTGTRVEFGAERDSR